MVFESGVPALYIVVAGVGGLLSPMEARGVGLTALRRRELVFSFVFLGSLSGSFPSLCITSANALPIEARFREWRIELRVVGFGRSVPLVSAWGGMIVDGKVYNGDRVCS